LSARARVSTLLPYTTLFRSTVYPFDPLRIYVHPPIVIMNEILMHLRALKKVNKDVSLHDPIGQDKEGNEISLIDILKAENENIIDRKSTRLNSSHVSLSYAV